MSTLLLVSPETCPGATITMAVIPGGGSRLAAIIVGPTRASGTTISSSVLAVWVRGFRVGLGIANQSAAFQKLEGCRRKSAAACSRCY